MSLFQYLFINQLILRDQIRVYFFLNTHLLKLVAHHHIFLRLIMVFKLWLMRKKFVAHFLFEWFLDFLFFHNFMLLLIVGYLLKEIYFFIELFFMFLKFFTRIDKLLIINSFICLFFIVRVIFIFNILLFLFLLLLFHYIK